MPAAETCACDETVLIARAPRRLDPERQEGRRARIEAAEQEGVDLPSGSRAWMRSKTRSNHDGDAGKPTSYGRIARHRTILSPDFEAEI